MWLKNQKKESKLHLGMRKIDMSYKKQVNCILCGRIMLPKDRKNNNVLGYSIPIATINPDSCNFRQFCLEIRFGYDSPQQRIYRSRMCFPCKEKILDYVRYRSGMKDYIDSLRGGFYGKHS